MGNKNIYQTYLPDQKKKKNSFVFHGLLKFSPSLGPPDCGNSAGTALEMPVSSRGLQEVRLLADNVKY